MIDRTCGIVLTVIFLSNINKGEFKKVSKGREGKKLQTVLLVQVSSGITGVQL